jgi:hypothetical protein
VRANVTLPVTVTAAVGTAYRPGGSAFDGQGFLLVSQACGGALNVSIGGSAVNIMGVQVMLNPVVLDVGANSGGLIGSLVCQILGLLGGGASVAPLLNSLLMQLVPLLGLVSTSARRRPRRKGRLAPLHGL